MPWAALVEALEPHYPKSGRRGRPPMGLERMLRLYIAQQCFGLSDEGAEDAVYDSQAIAGVGIDLSREAAPDATTLLKFRRLLETQADRLLHGEESDTLGRVRERLEQAKVEHPFQVIKQRFGHRKVRYRGLAKNQAQLYTLFGLANLVLARRRLLETCV